MMAFKMCPLDVLYIMMRIEEFHYFGSKYHLSLSYFCVCHLLIKAFMTRIFNSVKMQLLLFFLFFIKHVFIQVAYISQHIVIITVMHYKLDSNDKKERSVKFMYSIFCVAIVEEKLFGTLLSSH